MKFVFVFILPVFCMHLIANNSTQENAPAPSRTPEQEAALQTEKLQQELNLSEVQIRAIYEINLKHARERQVSNSRSQALERVKNKNAEIREVLTREQYSRLQDKRYERHPSVHAQINNSNMQQRMPSSKQEKIAPMEHERYTENSRRQTVAPSEKRNYVPARVPNRDFSSPTERRQSISGQALPSERQNIPQRRSYSTPYPRSNSVPEQNRNMGNPSRSGYPSSNERPARR